MKSFHRALPRDDCSVCKMSVRVDMIVPGAIRICWRCHTIDYMKYWLGVIGDPKQWQHHKE